MVAANARLNSTSGLDEAISLATRRVPLAHANATVAEIADGLRGDQFDTATEIPVLDGDRLVGMIRIEDLFAADNDVPAHQLMDPDPPRVREAVDQEIAVWLATQRNQRSIAVVDSADRFLGVIPAERMLGVLLAEHDEDMARLGGYTHDISSARSAAEEKVSRRLKHRLPWLMVGLIGALFTAGMIGAFESLLAEHVMLLFFIPSVVYLADAVGTQTETIIIRGLSVGVSIRGIILRELLTGVFAGITIAAAFLPLSILLWSDVQISIIVSLAIVAACTIATIVAMILPHTLQRFGSDPAFGSGPLATVIQDLLSVALFLLIALIVVSL
jgi:magnesium transporter